MRVILLENVDRLGNMGSEVTVRSGYARNFLIPKSKAILATKKNVDMFKAQQLELQVKSTEIRTKSVFYAETINKLGSIFITAKAGVEGKLFGSIGSRDIATAITTAVGFNVSKSQVRLPNNNLLKTTGTYNIKIHIYNEIFAKLNIVIVGKTLKTNKL